MITAAFRALLLSDPDVSRAVSSRIYPMTAPETASLPLITYQRISESSDADLLTHTTRIQADCYGQTYDGALQLAESVRRALLNRTYETETETIMNISFDSSVDFYDAETRLTRIVSDFMLFWKFNQR